MIADREPGDIGPDRLDDSCEVASGAGVLGRAEARDQTDEKRLAANQMPVGGIDRGRVHLNAYLAAAGRGRLHRSQLENIGRRPVPLVQQRRHTP